MKTNNLGQPTFEYVLELLCSTCNAVTCAGCPLNEGINKKRQGQVEYFGEKELQSKEYCVGHAAPIVNGYCFECGLTRIKTVFVPCPDCDGRGGYNNAGGATSCSTCEGTGKVETL